MKLTRHFSRLRIAVHRDDSGMLWYYDKGDRVRLIKDHYDFAKQGDTGVVVGQSQKGAYYVKLDEPRTNKDVMHLVHYDLQPVGEEYKVNVQTPPNSYASSSRPSWRGILWV
jgi:ribosomal protein L21E